MTLTIEVSGELEAVLNAQAGAQGLTADGVARRVLTEALTPAVNPEPTTTLELPVFHLGTIGTLHRRDIYEDGR